MKVKVKQEPHLGEWRVEVWLHSTPDGGELRASLPGHFTSRGNIYSNLWIRD
jgi:hypothetical protein